MGFSIGDDGLVSVDHSVRDFGDITEKGNPTQSLTKCDNHPMKIYSIFLRRKSSKHSAGDNCPLVYALKNKRGLYATRDSINDLCEITYDVMKVFLKARLGEGTVYDIVIPMPSSHKISYYLAKKISSLFVGSVLVSDIFRKATADNIVEQLDFSDGIPHEARVNIINAVNYSKENGVNFSIGDVSTKYRDYVSPLIFDGCDVEGKKILLVDDLFSTGATMISAKNHIRSVGGALKVDGLCLFSPLDGRIRR